MNTRASEELVPHTDVIPNRDVERRSLALLFLSFDCCSDGRQPRGNACASILLMLVLGNRGGERT